MTAGWEWAEQSPHEENDNGGICSVYGHNFVFVGVKTIATGDRVSKMVCSRCGEEKEIFL